MSMKLLMGAVAATILFSTLSASHAQSTFADVPDNHWAAQAVKRLAEAGIIIGRPASANVTNAESVVKNANDALSVRSDANDALSLVIAVKKRVASEPYLQGSMIDVATFTSRGEKIILLNGSVTTKAQRSFAGYIAADAAPKYRIINYLSVNPKENQQ